MQNAKATILTNQPYFDVNGNRPIVKGHLATYNDIDFSYAGNTYYFSKVGSLNSINQIYFIVSYQTASASELLINC